MEKRATSLFNSFCSNVAKEVERFCCPFYRTFKDLSLRGTNNNGSHEKGGRNLKKRQFFRTFLFSCTLYVSSRKAGALRDETSRARTRQPKSLSRPQSPSFLGHVVGYKNAEWLRDENAKIPDQLSRALLASQLVLAPLKQQSSEHHVPHNIEVGCI